MAKISIADLTEAEKWQLVRGFQELDRDTRADLWLWVST